MFNWLARNRMGLAVSLAGGLLLAIAVITVSGRHLLEQYEAVRHTTALLAELDGIMLAATDADSRAADHHLRALRALAGDDGRRQRQLDALEPLVANALRARPEPGSRPPAPTGDRSQALSDSGRRSMQDLRSTVAAMRRDERGQLTEQSSRYARQARQTLLALTALVGVAFLVLVGVGLESRRREREAQTTRDVLRTEVAEHARTSALLTSLVQSSDDAIAGLDLAGRILAWNTGAAQLYGLREDEARDRPVDILFPPERQAEVAGLLERVRRNGATERIETDHAMRDGRRLQVLLALSPIRDPRGALVGLSLVGRDVTTQKQAEQALRSSEATARAFLESVSESIVVANAAGRIVLVNARTESMFGYARTELIGQPVEILVPTALRDRHVRHRTAYMAAPRTRSMGQGFDLAGRRKDGTEFPVEISLSFVQTEDGIHAMAFVTDISERLAFQRAARQADKLAALGILSAGLAHEINNPIGIISSRVEVMLLEAEGSDLPAEMRKDLEVILHHARRVGTITQKLLSFARQSSGARGPVSLNRVVEEMVLLARKDLSRQRVQVIMKLDEHLPAIVADANAIGQVILNLLTNALRAMPEGGEIAIESSQVARSARLTVRDTGTGIPPEILPKIFDPFFTTKPDGTGLGLSISHGIIEEHRGTVDVRSEVGQGTIFTLTFPLAATTA